MAAQLAQMSDQTVLISLLIRIGLMAAMATVLVRFTTFKHMFYEEREEFKGRLYFTVLMATIFVSGTLARLLLHQDAVDLGLEGALLAGLIAGSRVGIGVGLIVGLPPLITGEWATWPMTMLYGFVGGLFHQAFFRDRTRIFFSPLTFVLGRGLHHDAFRREDLKRDFRMLLAIVALESVRFLMHRYVGTDSLFALRPESGWILAASFLATALMVAVPLMIWDHAYMEMALVEQKHAFTKARLDVLRSRIQPHFLFNTLNTIAVTIGSNPQQARDIVTKLAHNLRALLDINKDFHSLGQELTFIDNYLQIEQARYGEDQLKVHKHIDPNLLSVTIPNLILQPLVENAVIHGLRSTQAGRSIVLTASLREQRLYLSVEDDGVGIAPERLDHIKKVGIGLSNLAERLQMLFGSHHVFSIDSTLGQGTKVTLEFPINQIPYLGERREQARA